MITCLLMIDSQFVAAGIQDQKTNGSQITIYYGLNDSHSRSWAQINNDGFVGISYFQRFEKSDDEGTLLYKTIHPDGSENIDTVTSGTRLEKSVLLFDAESDPHIFVARSDEHDQVIDHYYKNSTNHWHNETLIHFYNEGGKFIYELSADTGPDYSFHLLILKTRSDVDSEDFMDAWIGSNLYHLTNGTGNWEKDLVHHYDMAYTYDMYIKSSIRQDIKVDDEGYVHVIFAEQIHATDDPSRLWYATNKTGNWEMEIALNNDYGAKDDAGWYPSLCLDNSGTPYISCMYVNRVLTHSAVYCKLFLLKRLGDHGWGSEIIAERDDGYYGGDGRKYTGGLSHLVFDKNNTPHIIFSDIASTHWPGTQRLNVGNIRYGILKNGAWDFTTIYRQPLPVGFFNAVEMHGMCLLVSEATDTIHVVGQELVTTEETQYACNLLHFAWEDTNEIDQSSVETDQSVVHQFRLHHNYPNPFNNTTLISYSIPRSSFVTLKVYDLLGREIQTLVSEFQQADSYVICFDASQHASGIYFCVMHAGNTFSETMKLVLLR
ncbi:MAG: T9SS type A sorting domain-containing protein [Gemmatimonadota bacterium]|nr:MAG: T9SS type A sorting domain-containing protein [Gemmatimonadota bacterium]